MEQYYTNERNVQLLIGLLKAHGIKRIVASPGSTNVTIVGSLQQDPYFEMYSCVDERSAAYMAVGIASETGEPVMLSCTGATASRNYFSALTEAFYRKLPILAVTSTQDESKVGNMIPQVIDRTCQPKDTIKMSFHIQPIKDQDDEWDCMRKINEAILELDHHGKGPVHINLTTKYSKDFSVKNLPSVHKIMRYNSEDKSFPEIPCDAKVAIYVGTHLVWSKELTELVDRFCENYNAVVFTDTVSNYVGKYRVNYTLVELQAGKKNFNQSPDILIHMGNMSDECRKCGTPQHVWRLSDDGLLSDRFQKLDYVFEMTEIKFFEIYNQGKVPIKTSYYESCIAEINRVNNAFPEIPFSHIWIASKLHDKLPKHSVLHLGILSPLRSWSFFDIDPTVEMCCNQGGFGIDGNMSTLVGASLINKNKLYYAVVGDLSFFYDLNILGNRHIGNNIRILLINNSLGSEFHLFKQLNCIYVNDIDKFISAGGHNGRKSLTLVKHFAEDLGFEYISASTKQAFEDAAERFVSPNISDKSIIFEVFTNVEDENKALYDVWHIFDDSNTSALIKQKAKSIIGQKNIDKAKEIINIIKK